MTMGNNVGRQNLTKEQAEFVQNLAERSREENNVLSPDNTMKKRGFSKERMSNIFSLPTVVGIIFSIPVVLTIIAALIIGGVKYQWDGLIESMGSMESMYSTVFTDLDKLDIIFRIHDYWWLIALAELAILAIMMWLALRIERTSNKDME